MAAFPMVERLRQGILLRTLARAFLGTHYSGYPQDWIHWRSSCFLNGYHEDKRKGMGFVRVADGLVAAYFFDPTSPRNPFRADGPPGPYDPTPLLAGMPAEVEAMVDPVTLQSQMRELDGEERLVITAAFWNDGDALTAAEPWEVVTEHSGGLVAELFMDPERDLPVWAPHAGASHVLGLAPEEVAVIQELHRRKLAHGDRLLVLSSREADRLMEARGAWWQQEQVQHPSRVPRSDDELRQWDFFWLDTIRAELRPSGIVVPGTPGWASRRDAQWQADDLQPALWSPAAKDPDAFPTVADLRRGVERVVHDDEPEVAVDWQDPICYLDGGQGADGAIVLDGNRAVGCFFFRSSDHNPYRAPLPSEPYDLRRFLAGMPDHLRTDLLSRVLSQFVLPYHGVPRTIITTAFWGDGGRLDAAEPWDAVLAHSGDLVRVVFPDD